MCTWTRVNKRLRRESEGLTTLAESKPGEEKRKGFSCTARTCRSRALGLTKVLLHHGQACARLLGFASFTMVLPLLALVVRSILLDRERAELYHKMRWMRSLARLMAVIRYCVVLPVTLV